MRLEVPDALRSGRVRAMVQTAIVLGLIAIAWQVEGLSSEAETNGQQATAVNAILAQSCGAASFAELRNQGLIEECRLAQAGDLPAAIPEDELPEADADPRDVNPDVVADDDNATPADVINTPLGPTNAVVRQAVGAYFKANPLNTSPGYDRAIERAVATYLTVNPPQDGRPPTEAEIRDAVRASLLANPPKDGSDGRGVASAVLDGCMVVFTYSDGTTDRVGPVCGADGEPGPPPTDEQVLQAVTAFCQSNGVCRGEQGPPGVVKTADSCNPEPGDYVTDVDIVGPTEASPATITISCETASILGAVGG